MSTVNYNRCYNIVMYSIYCINRYKGESNEFSGGRISARKGFTARTVLELRLKSVRGLTPLRSVRVQVSARVCMCECVRVCVSTCERVCMSTCERVHVSVCEHV